MKANIRAAVAVCLLCFLCGTAMASNENTTETGVVKLDSGMIIGETGQCFAAGIRREESGR